MVSADITIGILGDEDTDEIVALYDRVSVTEPGIGPVPKPAWQRFVKMPQNLDGRDFRVARSGQRIVALAELHLKDQGQHLVRFCKLVVDPAYRRRGIATALLNDLLKIDPQESFLTFQCLVHSSWITGLAFLRAFGFAYIESEYGMRCSRLLPVAAYPLSSPVLERVAPPESYAADIARIHNEAYRNDAAFRSFTTEEMAHELRGYELWIARDDARVLGFCQIEREAALIWLESVAVDPNFQRSGLGTALLYRVMQNAQLSNNHPAALNVSSKNPRAIAVYERLGFVKHQETQRFSAPRSDLVAAMARREKE